jgi:ATP-dependent RNA helicase DDX51/DBP6
MSNFYARYVPPTKKAKPAAEPAAQLNGPTKRKLPEQDLALREPKKPRSASVAELKNDGFGVKRFVPQAKKSRNDPVTKPQPESASAHAEAGQVSPVGRDVLEKYRVTGTAKKINAEADVWLRRPVQNGTPKIETQHPAEPTKEPRLKKTKKKRKEKAEDTTKVSETVNDTVGANEKLSENGFAKHTSVRDRFTEARKKSEQHQSPATENDAQDTEKPELHGLEPLPQPPEVEKPHEVPSYSTLPPWLARGGRISQDTQVTFASIGLDDTLLANLKNNGLEMTLPVQSAVIPLLCKGDTRHDGDLAVAAATGSGKTLAYVLPMIQVLKNLAMTKLRGVIVVPTRELVKQVLETFNLYSEGTTLRAAAALGSRSIKEESEALIEGYDVYDEEAYTQQESKNLDWQELSLSELFERAKDEARQAPNHVTKYRSKVDVLICTPGRLVEHLQNTKGFSLDDIQWLVIDEVDRLLNESYQEWIEIVMPALQSRGATILQDEVLQRMGLELPPRRITKVILSATMTQDISKLNSLNLRNPRLLILDSGNPEESQNVAAAPEQASEPSQDATGTFQLPSTLTEMAVLVGDGSDKPLHLLQLLQTRIARAELPLTNGTAAHDSDTSSSDSSDDTSSDSDSDSDSDSGSDSSSSSSSSSTSPQSKKTNPSLPAPSKYPSTLIFTHSTSAAPRLARLLALLLPSLESTTAVLTRSTASSASSRRALKGFRAGTTSILITTDRASRGLDIPNIEHVINYDVPGSLEGYVHRVGRTARAGKIGTAWTLVEHRQGRWFDGEIGKGRVKRKGKIVKFTLDGVGKGEMKARYEEALKRLGEEVEGG